MLLVERITETTGAQDNLEALGRSGSNYADLTQARSALARERLSTSSLLAIESYNISVQLASQVTGLDIEAIAQESSTTVDALVERVDPELAASAALQDRSDADGSIFVYYPLMEAADELLAERQADERRLLRLAMAELGGVDGLHQLAEQLEVTSEVQLASARLADTYLALRLQLEGWDPGEEAVRFQTAWFAFARSFDDLDTAHRQTLQNDASVEALRSTFEETVIAVADDGAPSVALPLDENLLQALLPLQRFFQQFISAFEVYSEVTESSTVAFQSTVDDAENRLRAEIALSYAALALLAAAMTGSVLLMSRQVVSPLRRLVSQIRRLRDGETGIEIPMLGAKEIRQAAVTINEASTTLAEAEQRSRALATGSVPELDHPGPGESDGSIGASMRRSLDELSAVMQEREELRQQLEHAAFHDVLTGLANRRGFRIRLDEAMVEATDRTSDETDPESQMITALYLDLDRFKSVNDSFGHAAGDALLVEVADRLRTTVRSSDVVGRMGGDEFLIVTFDRADRSGRSLASSLKAVIEVPYHVDGRTFTVGASVGYHTAPQSTPIDLLIRCADAAAYYAKAHLSSDPVAYTGSIGTWMDDKNQATTST